MMMIMIQLCTQTQLQLCSAQSIPLPAEDFFLIFRHAKIYGGQLSPVCPATTPCTEFIEAAVRLSHFITCLFLKLYDVEVIHCVDRVNRISQSLCGFADQSSLRRRRNVWRSRRRQRLDAWAVAAGMNQWEVGRSPTKWRCTTSGPKKTGCRQVKSSDEQPCMEAAWLRHTSRQGHRKWNHGRCTHRSWGGLIPPLFYTVGTANQ